MVDALDFLQCPVCGTFYKPEITATGRTISHCVLPPYAPHFNAVTARMIEEYRLTDVVETSLTGRFLDVEV